MNNKYIYDICTPLKENVNYYFYLLMLFSFYNNIYLSIRLFIINYYFIDLFKTSGVLEHKWRASLKLRCS